MPNWCYTEYTIKCNDENETEKLFKLLEEWSSKPCIENGFGNNWLGNIVERSKIAKWDKIKKEFKPHFDCRGSICDLNIVEDEIFFMTETAWGPYHDMWISICDKYLPSGYEILFISEESGMAYYGTNNPYWAGKFNVENCFDYDDDFTDDEISILDNIEYNTLTEDEIKKLLKSLLKSSNDNVDELLSELDDSKFNNTLYIHKWELDKI